MGSYESHFARQQVKERRKAFRKHWPLFAAIVLPICVVLALVLKWLFDDLEVPLWVLGPFGLVVALWAARPQLDKTYHLQSGIEAEGWTSRDLKKALGRGWYVVDHISFGESGDVDHVAVGPSGLFAVESKYTDSTLDSRTGRGIVHGWVEQSQDNAQRVRRLLKHNYGHDVEVHPLVVTSGTEFVTLPAELEDKEVVRRRNFGKRVSAWRTAPRVLSSDQVETIRAALLDWRRIREDFERSRAV